MTTKATRDVIDLATRPVTDIVIDGTGVTSIDSTPIGATTPDTGKFTSVTAPNLTISTLADFTGATVVGLTAATTNLVTDLSPQLGNTLDANGHSVYWSKGADVASASILAITPTGNSFTVLGNAAISRIEPVAGTFLIGSVIMLTFAGPATLVNGVDLRLLGGNNIIVAVGDTAIFHKTAASVWEMVSFSGITADADWVTGTSTKPSLASPANIAAAVAAQGGAFGAPVDVQTFTASGVWTKPSNGSICRVQLWGGGGAGAVSDNGIPSSPATAGTGGGGGAYFEQFVMLSDLNATVAVVVGVGAPVSRPITITGGSSSFASFVAPGGYSGFTGYPLEGRGRSVFVPNGELGAVLRADGTHWDSGGGNGGNAVWGGAGGAQGAGIPEGSVSVPPLAIGGFSVYGGDGGVSDSTGVASPHGRVPGGGGAGGRASNTVYGLVHPPGHGGDGKVIVTTY